MLPYLQTQSILGEQQVAGSFCNRIYGSTRSASPVKGDESPHSPEAPTPDQLLLPGSPLRVRRLSAKEASAMLADAGEDVRKALEAKEHLGREEGRRQGSSCPETAEQACGVKELEDFGNLFDFAMANVALPADAKHPWRAAGGRKLLQQVVLAVQSAFGLLPSARRRYCEEVRELFFDSIPESAVEILSVDEVIQPHLLKRFLEHISNDMANSRCSVEATFHGTRPEFVTQILNSGLDPQMCVTGNYGRGAYVATHAGVAHQYAYPEESGCRYMCVTLAAVGSQLVRGREQEALSTTAADRLVNPTQYCFVCEDELYVSHLITYRTNDIPFCRIGGGFQDPFHVKLRAALRASERNERHEPAKRSRPPDKPTK